MIVITLPPPSPLGAMVATRACSVERLPLVPLEAKGHIERLREPGVGHRVGYLEPDRGDHARAVIEHEPQVVRPHATRADRAGPSDPEHRRRVPHPARLEVTNESLQILAQFGERQLEIDPLRGHQVVGAKKLARDRRKRNTEFLETIPAHGQAGSHGVTTVFLEAMPHPVQRGVQIESGNAATRAAPRLSFPGDEEGGSPIALH
jgi:hypothetical protein